jgi:ankyrin repeat protein
LLRTLTISDFLKLFPDINRVDANGNTLINYLSHYIESSNEVEKIKLLIKMGANINQLNFECTSPLISALTCNYGARQQIEEAIIALVNARADPNYHLSLNNSSSSTKKLVKLLYIYLLRVTAVKLLKFFYNMVQILIQQMQMEILHSTNQFSIAM